VPVHELRASGLEYLRLATELLHRVRLAHPEAGLWEAADLQWWWRMPRSSDSIEQLFWADGEGPVAAAFLTDSTHTTGGEQGPKSDCEEMAHDKP